MSHYSVLVIGSNIEKQLAPFNENTDECPEKYLSFCDEEDEMIKQWEEEETEVVKTPENEVLSRYDERFRNKGHTFDSNSHIIPSDCKLIKVSLKELYPTFEQCAKDYCNMVRDAKTKRYGYWYNKDAKWDYWQIGGRFSGMLCLKSGKKGKVGERSWTNKDEMLKDNWVDQAIYNNIDWEEVRKRQQDIREQCWETAQSLDVNMRKFIYKIDKNMTREEYINRSKDALTFAVLKDGQWFEKGKMGWWGMVSKEKDSSEWDREYYNLLKSLKHNTLLTIVDCHI